MITQHNINIVHMNIATLAPYMLVSIDHYAHRAYPYSVSINGKYETGCKTKRELYTYLKGIEQGLIRQAAYSARQHKLEQHMQHCNVCDENMGYCTIGSNIAAYG